MRRERREGQYEVRFGMKIPKESPSQSPRAAHTAAEPHVHGDEASGGPRTEEVVAGSVPEFQDEGYWGQPLASEVPVVAPEVQALLVKRAGPVDPGPPAVLTGAAKPPGPAMRQSAPRPTPTAPPPSPPGTNPAQGPTEGDGPGDYRHRGDSQGEGNGTPSASGGPRDENSEVNQESPGPRAGGDGSRASNTEGEAPARDNDESQEEGEGHPRGTQEAQSGLVLDQWFVISSLNVMARSKHKEVVASTRR